MTAKPKTPEGLDQEKLDEIRESYLADMGGAMSTTAARIGDHLGLYKALAGSGALTPGELAEKTKLSERLVREWLINQAASGYVEYEPKDGQERYSMSPEQAALLADDKGRVFLQGGFQFTLGMAMSWERLAESFKDGKGLIWGDHHHDLFTGVARFFDPVYAHQLVDVWMQALPEMVERLKKGVTVADIGCGYGFSTVSMAERFPNSTFFGYDNHEPSVERGREMAKERGIEDRVKFEAYTASDFPNQQYDVICMFNCLHDVGRYNEAASHIHESLKKDGLLFMMEPMGGDTVEDNFNAVGRLMTGASALCCTPHGVAAGGDGLGTVVTDKRLHHILTSAGFKSYERVLTTKYNRIFVGRP